MVIQYELSVTIVNLITNAKETFIKLFEKDIQESGDLLYNNHHVLQENVYLLELFRKEINQYLKNNKLTERDIEIDEFEAISADEMVDVYFEFTNEQNEASLKPTFKCYIHPFLKPLDIPELHGEAYDSTTIIWSWEDDGCAHRLVTRAIDFDNEDDKEAIIAELPIGVNIYTETGLKPNTAYTRRLISFNDKQISFPSANCTVHTETVNPSISLEKYGIAKSYDLITDEGKCLIMNSRMKAFHSGVGDFTDLKVYKQMDADFYQKFKAYFKITGRRIQKEKRFDKVNFNYKICLEGEQTVTDQEGEVAFDLTAYPREWVRAHDYMWCVKPITINTYFSCDVFLRKTTDETSDVNITMAEGVYEEGVTIPGVPGANDTFKFIMPITLVISIDMSGSMFDESVPHKSIRCNGWDTKPPTADSKWHNYNGQQVSTTTFGASRDGATIIINYIGGEAEKERARYMQVVQEIDKKIQAKEPGYEPELRKYILEWPVGRSLRPDPKGGPDPVSNMNESIAVQYVIVGFGGNICARDRFGPGGETVKYNSIMGGSDSGAVTAKVFYKGYSPEVAKKVINGGYIEKFCYSWAKNKFNPPIPKELCILGDYSLNGSSQYNKNCNGYPDTDQARNYGDRDQYPAGDGSCAYWGVAVGPHQSIDYNRNFMKGLSWNTTKSKFGELVKDTDPGIGGVGYLSATKIKRTVIQCIFTDGGTNIGHGGTRWYESNSKGRHEYGHDPNNPSHWFASNKEKSDYMYLPRGGNEIYKYEDHRIYNSISAAFGEDTEVAPGAKFRGGKLKSDVRNFVFIMSGFKLTSEATWSMELPNEGGTNVNDPASLTSFAITDAMFNSDSYKYLAGEHGPNDPQGHLPPLCMGGTYRKVGGGNYIGGLDGRNNNGAIMQSDNDCQLTRYMAMTIKAFWHAYDSKYKRKKDDGSYAMGEVFYPHKAGRTFLGNPCATAIETCRLRAKREVWPEMILYPESHKNASWTQQIKTILEREKIKPGGHPTIDTTKGRDWFEFIYQWHFAWMTEENKKRYGVPSVDVLYEGVRYMDNTGFLTESHYSLFQEVAKNIVDSLPTVKIRTKMDEPSTETEDAFKEWVPTSETDVEIEAPAEIDTLKSIHVESDPYPFTFDNTVTPVGYSKSEKRAIIGSVIPKSNPKILCNNLLQAIKDKVDLPDGYDFIKVKGKDTILVNNFRIFKDFRLSDEDNTDSSESLFSDESSGIEGTVDATCNIWNKGKSTTFGDDVYFITNNSKLQISGYTDAIIYDGDRYIEHELNAYDMNRVILLDSNKNYSSDLHNRKRKGLSPTGMSPSDINHHLTLIQLDDDVTISGAKKLKTAGDEETFDPLKKDIVAEISRYYSSPILDYRFNIEDPMADTPIKEILPDCDPYNEYLHIVFLRIYYANNIYSMGDTDKYYISNYCSPDISPDPMSDPPIVGDRTWSPSIKEGVIQWTQREWKGEIDNGWTVDDYIHFRSKPKDKVIPYYDELPGPNMPEFYGQVNGQYSAGNVNGKKDLVVDTPQFNIPTSVDRKTIEIYMLITEYYPEDSIVYYRWSHPITDSITKKPIDDITRFNGDTAIFSCDSVVWKDVDYYDVIQTINRENQEIFDNKTRETTYELEKPSTVYTYENYYLDVATDNSDVMPLRYPNEIMFDDAGKANVTVAFKGVVNATSKWSPHVHNGYYYLNQHEYYAYSEFDVQANFETYDENNVDIAWGHVIFDVTLRHKAAAPENYEIVKQTRSSLLKNENLFIWEKEKGLTLKPTINGEYYREYEPQIYESPVILFPNKLTTAGTISVDFEANNGATIPFLMARSYIIETGKWSDWTYIANNSVPITSSIPLSNAYQICCTLSAAPVNEEFTWNDYACCYLDWKDDISEANSLNVVTITDHITTGGLPNNGEFVSRIIDFGCESEIKLSIFASTDAKKYKGAKCALYYAASNDEDSLLMERVAWKNANSISGSLKGRYVRYKIIIPSGQKVYWLHKQITTKRTVEDNLPYIKKISMTGTYAASDIVENFINTEAIEIPMDGEYHTVFEDIEKVIGADILERNYAYSEIDKINIQCSAKSITLRYNKNILGARPWDYLNTAIEAKAPLTPKINPVKTPYIFVERDERDEHDIVKIIGTPQQYAPISIEDPEGNTYIELHHQDSFLLEKEYELIEDTKYIELPTSRYDPKRIKLFLDGKELDKDNDYKLANHYAIFKDLIESGHKIKVEYCILYSFIADIDRDANTTIIYLHTGEDIPVPNKVKVYFETNTSNNKLVASTLSLNPVYRTDYKGFIYLTDDHNDAYKINIYCNPTTIEAGGYDKLDICIEVLDILDNPVIEKQVYIDCGNAYRPTSGGRFEPGGGIIDSDSYITDINGVVHVLYQSAVVECMDIITARVITDDGRTISNSIQITNEKNAMNFITTIDRMTMTSNKSIVQGNGTEKVNVTVKVMDQNGQPIPNQQVYFKCTTNYGKLTPGIVKTDSKGTAKATYTSFNGKCTDILTATVYRGGTDYIYKSLSIDNV